MGNLQHRKGQEVCQPAEMPRVWRGRGGKEEGGAAGQSGGRQQERGDRREVLGHGRTCPAKSLLLLQRLEGAEQDDAGGERKQKVEGAVNQQGAEQGGRRQTRHQQQEDRFEDAQAARYMAEDDGDLGQQIDLQEARQRQFGGCGEQEIEDGGGQQPVGRADQELPDPLPQSRQGQLPAPQPQGATPEDKQQQVAGHGRQGERPHRLEVPRRDVRKGGEVSGEEQDAAADARHAQAEGENGEGGQAGDLFGRHPPGGVNAVADGAAGQQGETDVATESITGE